jgi:hypothetical protein
MNKVVSLALRITERKKEFFARSVVALIIIGFITSGNGNVKDVSFEPLFAVAPRWKLQSYLFENGI